VHKHNHNLESQTLALEFFRETEKKKKKCFFKNDDVAEPLNLFLMLIEKK